MLRKGDEVVQSVILFDGQCSFCDRSVQFIMKRDPDGYFKFAAQQSDTGMEFQTAFGIPHGQDGLLFVDEGVCYDRSSAALHIAKHLKGIWKVGFLFIIIPKPIRDFVYNQFAKRRYKWFGQKEHCRLPSKIERERFI